MPGSTSCHWNEASISQIDADAREVTGALVSGRPAGAALQSAQLAMAGARPYDHAARWAGFVLSGDPLARPALAASVQRVTWLRGLIAALLTACVLAAAIGLRRKFSR